MRRLKSVLFAVVGLLVIASMVMAAAGPNPGSGSTDVRFTNTSSSAAVVTIDYYNPSGNIESTRNANVPAKGSFDFLAADSGLGDGWNGSGVISSDQEGASVAFIYWTGGQSADGTTAATYSGVAQGATTLYCPSLAARPNVQKSLVAVQNADTGTADVSLEFFDRDGNAWSGNPVTASIPEGASRVWDLTDLNLPVTTPPGDGFLGSVKISSTNGKKLAAVVTMFWRDYSSAYNCMDSGSTSIVFPDVKRRFINNKWVQYGGNVVQNLGNATANVTVQVLDRNGNVLYTFNDTIPPFASHGYNTRFNANAPDPAAFHGAMGDDFNGALKVTSDQPLAAVYNGLTVKAGAKKASTYVAEGMGSTTIVFPAVYRVVAGNNWMRYNAILVYNMGNADANITMTFYDKNGNAVHTFNDTIPPGTSHGYNTRWGVSLPSPETLGDNFQGSVEVTSSQPVVGVTNVNYPDQQATYNAYKK